ncbi:MAG: tetratricopeptide repeat protein, partial [Rothia dentocariosa]
MTEPNKPLEQMTAQERLDLGISYLGESRFDKAIGALSSIRREEADPETYARAQLNLGAAYYAQSELDQSIEALSSIRREEADPETYAQAQFNIGKIYEEQGNPEQAIVAWSNIRREEADPETYARAQFNIGKIYEDKGGLERAKEAYCNAQDFFYYNYERVKRILECPPKVIKKLRGIAENTDEVLKSLQIIPDFESQVAHYSRASTAFTLLEKKRKDQKPSHFRLSTIRGVNDPTEGLVLGKYWAQQGISETIHTNDTATFISCFTFNHDSLNQFRLYGKENGQEATGVSLAFKKEFFSDQSDTLEFIAAPSIDPPSKLEQDSSKETEKPESNKLIGKSTLYRCIYLDPETGYWTLAQRDKSTFYREDKEKETAGNNWIEYSKKISKIEESFKDHLFDNNDSIIEKLKDIFKEYNT